MSAEALGAELLAEIEEERLDKVCSLWPLIPQHSLQANANVQLLFELRTLQPSGSIYHNDNPAIDKLVDIFTPTDAQRQHNQYVGQWPPATQTVPRPQRPLLEIRAPVIELTGVTPCSGKSQLLYHMLATTILPKEFKGITLPGKEQAAVVLDLSSELSLMRLYTVMEYLVLGVFAATEKAIQGHNAAALIKDNLQHLHIFRPQSHPALLATIAALPSHFLSDTTSHYSANRQLGAILIHHLSAFFWQDRQNAEEQRDAALLKPSMVAQDKQADVYLTRWRTLVGSLREAQQTFDCPIIATNWALASPVHSKDGSSLRPHLPAVWNNFCTFNVVLQRNSVMKFGPGISVEEALAEKDQRQEAVDASGFSGWVNWWNSEGWKEEIKTAVKAWSKHGGFHFAVISRGVILDKTE